jgi:exopolyphosphatase/guanosine-5'-triphosphate,3'-diphosphate pyrophosphatase
LALARFINRTEQPVGRYAVLDIGSNSLKLYAGRVVYGRVTDLDDRSVVNRLAEGMAATGEISEEAADRTIAAIKALVAHAEGLGVEKVVAVGTQALRQADNAREIATLIRNRCRIGLKVLSGKEEARLAYVAAAASLPLGDGPVTVFDAGGASTEVVVAEGGGVSEALSLAVGARVLTDRHCLSDPITDDQYAALAADVTAAVARAPAGRGELVGIGSTAVSLATVHYGVADGRTERVHGRTLGREVVETAVARLREMTLAEKRRIPGLNPARADVMLAGAVIVASLMERLGVDGMTVCNRGLRHGVFHDRFCA